MEIPIVLNFRNPLSPEKNLGWGQYDILGEIEGLKVSQNLL